MFLPFLVFYIPYDGCVAELPTTFRRSLAVRKQTVPVVSSLVKRWFTSPFRRSRHTEGRQSGQTRKGASNADPLPYEHECRRLRDHAGRDGDPERLLEKIRAANQGGDVHLVGGPRTIETFRALGALDKLELVVLPLLLGAGKRLTPSLSLDTGLTRRLDLTRGRGRRRGRSGTFPSPAPTRLIASALARGRILMTAPFGTSGSRFGLIKGSPTGLKST